MFSAFNRYLRNECVERNTSVRCAHDLVAQQSRRLASIESRLMPISLCINSTNNPINKLVSLLRQIRCFDLSCRVQLHLSDCSRANLTSSVNSFSIFFLAFLCKILIRSIDDYDVIVVNEDSRYFRCPIQTSMTLSMSSASRFIEIIVTAAYFKTGN